MKCPYCATIINVPSCRTPSEYLKEHERYVDGAGFGVSEGFCPACNGFIVLYLEGNYFAGDGLDVHRQTIIYPKYSVPPAMPPEIPDVYKSEYKEAYTVNSVSPKASAAISRRLLQTLLHEQYGINKRSLFDEINEFVNRADVPSHIADTIDVVRIIGNHASHPLKYSSTGELVDVEAHEAEWLLDLLKQLLDFAFVQPKRLQERKDSLEAKMHAIRSVRDTNGNT